jgi:glycosyltransferase involved in cell wall biosynthesis
MHRKSGCTLVPTSAGMATLQRQHYGRVRVLPRGVDTELFNPGRRSTGLRRRWGLADSDIVCIYVGRIAAEKNITEVISAYRKIQPLCSGKLVLVGDGPLRKKLQQQHPDFIFSGIQCGIELAEHYASGDLFLFPSLSETFGNVVTEAMASGLAVIAYDKAAAHELLHPGLNGMLVDPGRQPDFATTAIQLCRERGKIAALGKAAAEHARTLGWNRIVSSFVEILEQQIKEVHP